MDKNNECTIMCLKDIGCDEATVNRYIKLSEKGDVEGMIKLLSCTRGKVLEEIHDKQKKLDCLDYIIFHMKKEMSE